MTSEIIKAAKIPEARLFFHDENGYCIDSIDKAHGETAEEAVSRRFPNGLPDGWTVLAMSLK